MADSNTYGGEDKQFPVKYNDVDDPTVTYDQRYYVETSVKEEVNDETGQTETYTVTTLYRDPWGIGSHEEVGTLYSNTNVFQPSSDASDSQAAYFSKPGSKTLIRQQARDAIIRGREGLGYSHEEAVSYANEAVESNAADSQDLNDPDNPNNDQKDATSEPQGPTYKVRGVNKPKAGTLWKEKAFSQRSKTLIYPEDHAAEEFDFIKIVPIEYVPALNLDREYKNRSGTTGEYNINLNDADWFGFKSIKNRYLRVKQVGSTMFLPMTPDISENNAVDWGGDRLNPIQAVAGRIAFDAIENISNKPLAGTAELAGDLMNAGQAFMGTDVENFIKAYFAGKAVNANLLGRAGIVVNPNLEVLFNGPALRTFNYNFRFTPRTESEATTIRTIIKVLKKTMAPKRRDKVFLNVPAVYQIKYIFNGDTDNNHPFLNKIKPCALSGFNVSYAPDGSYMTYDDGSMTSYSLQMKFDELEPIYNDDINDVDDATTGF